MDGLGPRMTLIWPWGVVEWGKGVMLALVLKICSTPFQIGDLIHASNVRIGRFSALVYEIHQKLKYFYSYDVLEIVI